MNIETIDIILGALFIIFVLRCTLRGFVEEFMSVAAIVLGLIVGFLLFKNGADYLQTKIGLTVFPELAAFVLLFVGTFVVIKILEVILHDIIERIHINSMDHIFGLLLGFVEGALIISLILLILTYQPLFDSSSLLQKSWFAKLLLPIIGEIQRNPPMKLGA